MDTPAQTSVPWVDLFTVCIVLYAFPCLIGTYILAKTYGPNRTPHTYFEKSENLFQAPGTPGRAPIRRQRSAPRKLRRAKETKMKDSSVSPPPLPRYGNASERF